MPFEKGAGIGGDFVRSIGCRPRWRSRHLPPSGFIGAAGCRLCWGGRRDSVAPAFQPKEVFRRRACARFPFGVLLPAVWRAEAPSDEFAILLQTHGRLRSSRFIVRRRTCRRKPFFEADGRRRTCLGAGLRPDRSAGGVRYAVVPEPLRVLSVAYATACGGTGRRDFLFGAIWGRRLVPRPRPIRTAAGRNDERTGPGRGPAAGDSAATGGGRDAVAPVAPTAVRRLAAIVRGRPDSCRPALFFRSGAAVPQKVLPQICRGGRGIERDGTERSPRFRIFGTK